MVTVPPPVSENQRSVDCRCEGTFRFAAHKGVLSGESFLTLFNQLMRRLKRPLYWVQDGLPAHKTKVVMSNVAASLGRLKLYFLPDNTIELNPDELERSSAKRTGNARGPLRANS